MELALYVLTTLIKPASLLLILGGSILGIIFGSIPGLTGAGAIVLLLPITFIMPPDLAIILLMSVFIGGVSGSMIAAVMLGIPGSPASIATCFDGYPLSQKGETAKALGIAIISSFFGTLISVTFAMFVSKLLADAAVKLGPWEYFGLCLCAITLVASLSKGDMIKGLSAAAIGFLLGTVGLSPMEGASRFSFGIYDLNGGFAISAVMMGFFAIRQILVDFGKEKIKLPDVDNISKISGFGVSLKEIKDNTVNIIRSLFIGLFIGFLPGLGAGISNLVAYAKAKASSKHPEKFGTGCVDGIFASEVSNNATLGGVVIPMIALGIPGDATTALLLGALIIQGIQPGPLLFQENPQFVYLLFGGMMFATVMVLFIQFFGMRLFPRLLKSPLHYLYPGIILLCLVGAFADTNTVFNIGLMIFLGIIGVILSMGGFPMSTLILAYILSPLIELNLLRGIEYSDNGLWPFVTRPLSAFLLLVAVYSVLRPIISRKKKSKKINAN